MFMKREDTSRESMGGLQEVMGVERDRQKEKENQFSNMAKYNSFCKNRMNGIKVPEMTFFPSYAKCFLVHFC